jgi:hypothetical protein
MVRKYWGVEAAPLICLRFSFIVRSLVYHCVEGVKITDVRRKYMPELFWQ